MKFNIIQLILIVFLSSFIEFVSAETQATNLKTKITLVDGKKFVDYELTHHSRSKSLQILEKDFLKVFNKLSSKYLKEGQSISVDVTNLDLAGDIRFNMGPTNQDIRIVKDGSPIKLYFNFKVLAVDGSVLVEGEHRIREFLYLSSNLHRNKNRGNLTHFIPFLEKWFKKELVKKS